MHPPQAREEVVSVVAPEVLKEFRLFVESQKRADDLDGEDLRGKDRRGGSAPSETSQLFDAVADETEDGDDEGAIRSMRVETSFSLRSVWAPPSVRRSRSSINRSEKPAHEVS